MNTASCFISKRFKIFKKRSIDVFQDLLSGFFVCLFVVWFGFVCEHCFNLDFAGGKKGLIMSLDTK